MPSTRDFLQKIVILDIDAETGKRIALGMEKTYGEKKVHFIHADVSNLKQMSGKLQSEILKSRINVYWGKNSLIIYFSLSVRPLVECRYLGCVCSFAEAFEEASSLLGNIDIVVNNAGILDERRWEKEIAVNIVSILYAR